MKSLGVYLSFNGNCREALNFYADALGGEIKSIQTFGEAPPMPGDHQPPADQVMHSEFGAEGISFMASDGLTEPGNCTGITLNINLESETEQDSIFNKLSAGGTISMPLQDTFWGARFGQLTDKFGIQWMLNCEKQGAHQANG